MHSISTFLISACCSNKLDATWRARAKTRGEANEAAVSGSAPDVQLGTSSSPHGIDVSGIRKPARPSTRSDGQPLVDSQPPLTLAEKRMARRARMDRREIPGYARPAEETPARGAPSSSLADAATVRKAATPVKKVATRGVAVQDSATNAKKVMEPSRRADLSRRQPEETADTTNFRQQDQGIAAPSANEKARQVPNDTVAPKSVSPRKRRQTAVPQALSWQARVAQQHKEEAEMMSSRNKVSQPAAASTALATPQIGVDSIVARKIVSLAAATPSRIPRPDYVLKGKSPPISTSPLVPDAKFSRTSLPATQQILFPRSATRDDPPNNKQTPGKDKATVSPAATLGRLRQMSTASDIDDKLRQSMLRMPRVSGLSNTSPLSIFNPESGQSPSIIGRRALKQSPLANMTRSPRLDEVALSPSINDFTRANPLSPARRPRRSATQLVSITPLKSAYTKLEQTNKDLEEEKMDLLDRLEQLQAETAEDDAKRRDIEVAKRWREVASACQAELAQLKREKAQRVREMGNFERMVTLAKLVV